MAGEDSIRNVLTLGEASEFLRCSKAHLSNLANGKIPGVPPLKRVRIGRRVLFRKESLEQWLREVEAQVPTGP